MEATHLRRPWLHSPGWTTQGQRLCLAVASSQGQVAAGAGPVRQPVRARRRRWRLRGEGETGGRLSMTVRRDRGFILFHIGERLQQGTGTVSWASVWAAFWVWDQGGPAEVTLKPSSAVGGG